MALTKTYNTCFYIYLIFLRGDYHPRLKLSNIPNCKTMSNIHDSRINTAVMVATGRVSSGQIVRISGCYSLLLWTLSFYRPHEMFLDTCTSWESLSDIVALLLIKWLPFIILHSDLTIEKMAAMYYLNRVLRTVMGGLDEYFIAMLITSADILRVVLTSAWNR